MISLSDSCLLLFPSLPPYILASVLAFAHHRYTSKGHDDILLPAGVVTEVYQATPSAPTSLPPSARASVPPSFPSSMEGEEETKMEGDYATLKV